MQYEWRCPECRKVHVVRASVADRDKQPEIDCCGSDLKRVIVSAPSVPFNFLRNMGVFADEYTV